MTCGSSPSSPIGFATMEEEEGLNSVAVEAAAGASLLELASGDDAESFARAVEGNPAACDEVGLWYGRKKGSNRMVLEHRTPLMVAATYGSVGIVRLITGLPAVDVNRRCGPDKATALHCAASGGSANAVEVVKLLLSAGADPNLFDANGHRPADVIAVPPNSSHAKIALEELLGAASGVRGVLRVYTSPSGSHSPPLSSSPDANRSPSSDSSDSSAGKFSEHLPPPAFALEKKEYPVDPTLPDIKSSVFATDEFRMYSFKVRPCSRAYSHDWTECPFVHPGENARRRDPRKYHYSSVACPDFRKSGACRKGDMCEYAHGVFESWLHPAQYRTKMCKDGASCNRRVCFFAHTEEELRLLPTDSGSVVSSPRSSAMGTMDMAAAMNLLSGSPSSVSLMPQLAFSPPISPSANGVGHFSMVWPQNNVPALHLAGNNMQCSRLRTSLSSRDIPVDDLSMVPDFEAQQRNNMCFASSQARLSSSLLGNRSIPSKSLAPSNLDDLFSEVSLSPRYNSDLGAMLSPSHKPAVLNQRPWQGSLLSPINTNVIFSPKALDPQEQLSGRPSLLQSPLGSPCPGRMSPRGMEPVVPLSHRFAMLVQREKLQQQLGSHSARDLGSGGGVATMVGSPVKSSWPEWGSPTGKVDWGMNAEELNQYKQESLALEFVSGVEEPDVSWVQSLVNPPEAAEHEMNIAVDGLCAGGGRAVDGANLNLQMTESDHTVLGAWLEQMQLEQLPT